MDNNTLASFIRPFSTLVLLAAIALLAACGGGGGGSDTTPDMFSFSNVTDADLNVQVTSPVVTVMGIDAATNISISGGEYSINSGAFVSTSGQVSNGDTVAVRQTSSSEPSTETIATVTIGGVSGAFSVTTFDDTEAPTASIIFPPPVSLTEGTSILVRGTASDNVGVTSLSVNGMDAVTTDGFATWTADVSLTTGSNELVVTVNDASGNEDGSAAQVSVESGNPTFFPDDIDFFGGVVTLALDQSSGRNRLIASDFRKITSIDLATGERELMVARDDDNPVDRPQGIIVDEVNDRAIVVDSGSNSVYEIDLTTNAITLISENSNPASAIDFSRPSRLVLDDQLSRLLITDRNDSLVIAVNLTDGSQYGERTAFSSNTIPGNNPAYNSPIGVTLDANNGRLFVASTGNSSVIEVDIGTGAPQVISNPSTSNSIPISIPVEVLLDSQNDRLIYIDANDDTRELLLGAVNLVDGSGKGARTLLSDSSTDLNNQIVVSAGKGGIQVSGSLAYVTDGLQIIVVDLISGKRVVLSRSPFSVL